MIKSLENKYDELNKELKSFYDTKNNKEDIDKIKNENIELKLNMGKKEKQLNNLTLKLKELNENKLGEINDKELNLKTLKNDDIPKLKEIFKVINKTVTDYAEIINKLEQNKDLVFHDKFIEFSKSTLKKICNNWNEELSQFKEDHFKTMVSNYRKEISELKKDNIKLVNELEQLYTDMNEKNIEILKLNEKLKMDEQIKQIKEDQIKSTESKYDSVQKELEIYKVRVKDKEDYINTITNELGNYKSKANMMEDEFENIKELMRCITRKDKRSFNSISKKTEQEFNDILNSLIKTYKIF